MTTQQRKAAPVSEGRNSEIISQHVDPQSNATDAFHANLTRMARKAASCPGFYEIAGGTVQHLADKLKAAGAIHHEAVRS